MNIYIFINNKSANINKYLLTKKRKKKTKNEKNRVLKLFYS